MNVMQNKDMISVFDERIKSLKALFTDSAASSETQLNYICN